MVNGPRDPYIGQTNAGTKNRTLTMTTSYALLMPENAARVGWDMANISGAGDITVRLGGSGGEEYKISAYGSFSRNKHTGSVWVGEIYAKGAAGSEVLTCEEH